MPKNIRDYTIYEVIELPSSVIENLSIEDKAFYIDIILNKDNSCVNAFAEVVMFVNEKDLDIKQKLIINNIVEFYFLRILWKILYQYEFPIPIKHQVKIQVIQKIKVFL